LACRPTLQQKLDQSATADERAAYHILLTSLEAPVRAILSNAGYEASEVMAKIYRAGEGYGFDVRSRQVVGMAQAGIWDAAAVVKAAVRGAISNAALALTTDVLVHHKTPQQSVQP
jgi:chaperonin GroEL